MMRYLLSCYYVVQDFFFISRARVFRRRDNNDNSNTAQPADFFISLLYNTHIHTRARTSDQNHFDFSDFGRG